MAHHEEAHRRQDASAHSSATGGQQRSVDPRWEELVLGLRAAAADWLNGPDEIAIARYLSGDCSAEESREIEQALRQSSDLRECVALAQEALKQREAAA